jgi:hypothetical protein
MRRFDAVAGSFLVLVLLIVFGSAISGGSC